MRSPHLAVALAVTGALLLGGCQGDVPNTANSTAIPALGTPDSIYLVNPFTQKLVVYDRGSHQILASQDEPNYFYYAFTPQSDLYTAGHSIEHGFTLVKVSDREISTLETAATNEGLFPLAATGTSVFLNKVTYDPTGGQTSNSIVVRQGDGSLREYFEVPGAIEYGAIADGRLYYSVYDESAELYQVYSFQIGDFSSAPKLERSGLAIGRIYVHHDQIIYPDGSTVQDGDNVFPCTDLCYFYDEPDVFVRVAIDENGDLGMTVYDGSSGEVLGHAAGLVGFKVTDTKVVAYCIGAEVSIPVGTS